MLDLKNIVDTIGFKSSLAIAVFLGLLLIGLFIRGILLKIRNESISYLTYLYYKSQNLMIFSFNKGKDSI